MAILKFQELSEQLADEKEIYGFHRAVYEVEVTGLTEIFLLQNLAQQKTSEILAQAFSAVVSLITPSKKAPTKSV